MRIGLVTALAAGVLAAGGCASDPRCPPGASCPAIVPRVAFIPTINGVSFPPGKDGHVPSYRVRPGADQRRRTSPASETAKGSCCLNDLGADR
jgi:hypothetical protein